MDASRINTALYSHFANYEYKLNNTFVFNWESDFFAQSKSGYFVECEVKISRSDYLRDFAKDKHELFKTVLAKKTHHVYRQGEGRGDLISRVRTGTLSVQYGPGSRSDYFNRTRRDTENPDNWRFDFRTQLYTVNDYGRVGIHWRDEAVHAPASRIHIVPVEKIKVPHQFYFTCPEGLIKPAELPPYAGLLYIRSDNQCVQVIKRAPYLHKTAMDLRTELLQKYYNLWKYKVGWDEKNRIRGSYSEKEAV